MSIYPVREDTLLLKRNIEEEELQGENFLEIGVGNAEVSLAAARQEANVTAVDINSEAVEHAKHRFEEKSLDSEVFHSDLFDDVEGKYNLIVFNPPYLKGREGIGDEEMWRGGETGLEVPERFLGSVKDYLSDEGKAWVVLSSRTDYEKLVEKFDLVEVDREKLWFETVFLFEFE